MTCKDCIYFKRCVVLGVELDMCHDKEADKNCRHFKNKADFAEVKHGKWIDVPLNVYNDRYGMNKYNFRTKCSVCEYAMPREYPRFNICPCCGAKMDEEE